MSDIDPVLRRVLDDAGLPGEDADMMRGSSAYSWARLYAAVAELGRAMVPRRWRRERTPYECGAWLATEPPVAEVIAELCRVRAARDELDVTAGALAAYVLAAIGAEEGDEPEELRPAAF